MALLSYWPCNEGTGTTAKDIIGGRDLTLTNGPTWGTNAVVYDGVNDYSVKAATDFGLNGTTEVSVSFTLKTTDTSGRIIAKGIADAINTFRITKDDIGVPIIYMEFDNLTGTQTPSWYFTYPSDGLTHRVTVTFKVNAFDATDGIMYLDGVAQSTTFSAGGYVSGFTLTEISSDLIVAIRPFTFTDPLAGEVGQIRVWNTQLTAGEVMALQLANKIVNPKQAVRRASNW